jgi:HEPN domain-containing protein
MPDRERNLVAAREWVAKAENDLKNAKIVLRAGTECPTDTVCFHAQQCVEKHVKALLVLLGISFARTHDIGLLMALVPKQYRIDLDPASQDRLTEYPTLTRYPGDYEPISLHEARDVVRIASRVRNEIRKRLPEVPPRKRSR